MKTSAGILCYKFEDNKLQVMISHMGGPYWTYKDNRAWSIPKGEYINESSEQAARREFNEETGFEISSMEYLGEGQISKDKVLTVYISESDFNTSEAQSNSFEMEWPKGSGIIKTFPECDKTQWFTIEEAREKLTKGQVQFLDILERKLCE